MIGSRRVDSCTWSGGYFDRQWSSTAVSNQVDLVPTRLGCGPMRGPWARSGCHWRLLFLSTAPAAARAARTLAPSTHHRSQSIGPAVELELQRLHDPGKDPVPSPPAEVVVHRLPWVKAGRQVTPGVPVQRIHKMPSSIRRGSEGVRPVVAVRFGSRSGRQTTARP